MSIAAWMRRQSDRPIAEHERHIAIVAVTVLLCAVAVLLTLAQPASQASKSIGGQNTQTHQTIVERHTLAFAPDAQRVTRRFLAGYLAYTYGRAPASQITGASPSLIRSLQAHPPRVPPAARARHPRILSLHPTTSPEGRFGVSATVNDGELIDYQISVLLTPERGRLTVAGLDGAR